jgi:hypothetical protein
MQRSLIDHTCNVLAEIEGLKTLTSRQLNQRWRECSRLTDGRGSAVTF